MGAVFQMGTLLGSHTHITDTAMTTTKTMTITITMTTTIDDDVIMMTTMTIDVT